jgi:ATP-dependent Clp protease ATP-binding subunit ClpC
MADWYEKFTDQAMISIYLAKKEAEGLKHNYVGTEHLLLGLIESGTVDSTDVVSVVFDYLGIDTDRVRSGIEFVIGRGNRSAEMNDEFDFTPRAKRVIELAVNEANRRSDGYVGAEHLLLGLVREGEGIAASILESMGLNFERVRREVERVLREKKNELSLGLA